MHTRAPVPFASSGPIACIDETIALYLGRPDVAAALHVLPNLHWAVCGSNSSFDYTRTEADERIDVYPTVYNAGVRVLIFNGEADACVPWIDNNNWVASMNFTVAQSWTSWESLSQNAGYVTQYTTPSGSHFDFATVKGAGHSAWGPLPAASACAPSCSQPPHFCPLSPPPSRSGPGVQALPGVDHVQRLHQQRAPGLRRRLRPQAAAAAQLRRSSIP